MDNWDKVSVLFKKLERETDLKFDCLMQIISEELGDKHAQALYRKAMKRFNVIKEEKDEER